MTTLGAAGGMAVAYFLAAQLGLALTSQPSGGAAVFWPASGLAVGFLIISGRRAYPALLIGLVIGTLAANLLSDRSLLTATFKGLCNAGEAVLAAWVLERWFGRPFTMGDLRAVAGLLSAAGLAAAASAFGGAATMTLFHAAAPFWDVWRTWFLSDGVGIVMAAPLVIGLDQLWREPPTRRELIEGVGVLALLSLARLYVMHHPSDWFSFNPAIVVLPPLLWLVVRCPPVFAIAGAFVASILIFCETTYGIGRYGDAAVPIMERVKGAQAIVATGAIFILVLGALFAERRRSEAELKQSNNRLQLALDCAELGTWSLHLDTGRFENDLRDRRIHWPGQEAPPRTLAETRSQVHPDDLSKLDAAFGELGHASGSCRTEYRLAPRTDQERAGRERWVALEGTVVRRANGRAEQLLGVTRDITERKHAENALLQREVELGEAQRLARIGSWYWDSQSDVLVGSDELFRIYGFDPATPPADFRREFGRRYSADDLKRLIAAARRAMQTGVGYELDLRAFRNGTPIWLTARAEVVRNGAGQIVGLRGTVQDITERKQAELALAERNTQFELASKAARVGSFSVDLAKGVVKLTPGCAALYGLPEGTAEISSDDDRKRVHPRDLVELEALRDQALLTQQHEFIAQFRIVRADDGEVRWIEARNQIFYDQNGKPSHLIGVSIDLTERKSAEHALAERNLQLRLAAKAGLVGTFTYDTHTEIGQISPGYAAIHGLPEATAEITRSEWLARVHPEDVERVQLFRSKAFRERREEYSVDYRIVRRDGEVRWIESRVFILYGSDPNAHRVNGVNIDVTDRKRAEALIKESKARLADALAAGQVMAFEWDALTGVSQRSDNATDILESSYDDLAGSLRKDFLRHVHPDDRTSLKTRIHKLRPWNPSYALTFRFIRPDGRLVWLEETAKGEFDATGKLLRIKGLTRDITDRKRAEDALAERNAQIALAGRAALVGTYTYDVNKGAMQISEGYSAIHGLPEGTTETSYSEWRARVHPEDLGWAEGSRNQAFANRWKEDTAEYRIVLPTGEVRWIERRGSISYSEDGRPERVVGVNIDVTERRRTEQALTDRDRQLKLGGKAALVGSFAIDIDAAREDFGLQLMHFSPGFAAIYGLPEETVEISLRDWRSRVHPDDLPKFLEHRQQLFAERRGEHDAEFRIVRPCGTIRWIETRSFIEYDQAGHARRLVGVQIDITERKRAEEARKILNAELDHRVKNALATVSAVVSHTRRGRRSVADFAAAVEGRIHSMAATHELLSSRQWQGLSLMDLVRRELAPYATRHNTEINGPEVGLRAEAGQAMAMVLHELATNAAKYGAFSTEEGRVSIWWSRQMNGHPPCLVLDWQEIGGPPVIAPDKSSFGTSTIRDLIPYEFGGTVDLVFAPEGVRCRLELPADWLSNAGEPLPEAPRESSPVTGDT